MSEETPESPQEQENMASVEVPAAAFSDAPAGSSDAPRPKRGRPAGSKNRAPAPRTPRAATPAANGSEDLPPFAVAGLRSMRVVERMTYPASAPYEGKTHLRLEGYVNPRQAEAIIKAIGVE